MTLEDGTYIRMHFTDSGNEWDASVDYDVYKAEADHMAGKDPDDGGQMDFDWKLAGYTRIQDAVHDVVEFALGMTDIKTAKIEVIEE